MRGHGSGRAVAVVAALAAIGLALLAGCGGGGPEATTAAPPEPEELRRHLRLAVEELRRDLAESAAAELTRAGEIDPEDPEVLFQRARLRLLVAGRPAAPDAAIDLLVRSVAAAPDRVRGHRLLYVLYHLRGDRARAAAERAEVVRCYGRLGAFEMLNLDRFLEGDTSGFRFLDVDPVAEDDAYAELVGGLSQLERDGRYQPNQAVATVERVITAYPELAAVRLGFARLLLETQVRVELSTRPDMPLMSSRLIADFAQVHFERALDQSHPLLQPALVAHYGLSAVGLRMADYDSAVTHLDVMLSRGYLEAGLRWRLGEDRALARFKQGRFDQAISILEGLLVERGRLSPAELSALWLLHQAYIGAGVAMADRRFPFRLRGELAIESSTGGLAFTDVAAERGVAKFDGYGPSAWGDYDRDGDDDLYVSGGDSYGALYRNDGGGHFHDVSVAAGLFHVRSGFSAVFVDVDNDGWQDLFVARDGWSGPGPNALYRNLGDGRFREVTVEAGLGDRGSGFVAVWLDYDRDGLVDLYFANGITGGGDTNRLFRNLGDGTFGDLTEAAGLSEPRGTKTIGLAVGDIDGDGWTDIFVSGYGSRNRLYLNRGDGSFEEAAERLGVDGADHITNAYVSFLFDYDDDGDLDILRTTNASWVDVLIDLSAAGESLAAGRRRDALKDTSRLYRNDRDAGFVEVSLAAGLGHPIGSMGGNVADLDNDGYEDLYLGTGDPAIRRLEPDRFLRNRGDGSFVDQTFVVGLGNLGKGHGITLADIDRDGDLDIYSPEGGFEHGDRFPNALYLNRLAGGNHWLQVELEGVTSNRDAIGARLELEAGPLKMLREVHGGRGWGSCDSHTVAFGLGLRTAVKRLTVTWPSGLVQELAGVPVDRRIALQEGGRWRLLEGGG